MWEHVAQGTINMAIIGEMSWPRSEFDSRLGRKLAVARRDARLTQEEAAERIGVGPDTLIKWELGVRRPGLERIRKAAILYGVTVDFLLSLA